MKIKIWILTALIALTLVQAQPAAANQRLIIRTTSLPLLQKACLLNLCNVVGALDGTINRLFLVTLPDLIPLQPVEKLLRLVPGVQDVEADVLQHMEAGVPLNGIPAGLNDRQPVNYFGNQVWHGYAAQPASTIIRLGQAQILFGKTGHAIVADINTGVDFSHPALRGVLLQGYDFTRNQPGGNEMADYTGPMPGSCTSNCTSGTLNQSSAAALDQSSAAALDQSSAAALDQSSAAALDQSTVAALDSPQYSDFGHGTMVAGMIHLVAPTAMILPVKTFSSNGTGYTSDILKGIYYAVQNNANVINMSFDFTTSDSEFAQAIAYAQSNNVTCVASAGNEGSSVVVYAAGLPGVIGVASTNNLNQRSTFSNFGPQDVFVAAPGENVISTYPFETYASESGTSFSAPLVSGTVALLLDVNSSATQYDVSTAIGHAQPLSSSMGHGLLDVVQALSYMVSITH
jgi:subtilisin family serine protease